MCEQEEDVHYNPIIPHDYSQDYLTFVALEDGTFTFSGNAMQYSIDDGATWQTLASNTASPTVAAGNKIMWKQTGLVGKSQTGIGKFISTGRFNCEGNAMSLHYGDNFIGQTDLPNRESAFEALFKSCTNIVSCENLVLPATTLSRRTYFSMFSGCTSLTTPPSIIPATTFLDSMSCQNMFRGCTSLMTAPQLPATTLGYNCYSYMFHGCTSLTTAPALPAATLTSSCYSYMFYGCTSLNSITCLATDISESMCTSSWVNGVASSGTFTKAASMTSWTTGVDGIPTGWTVQDAS